MKNSPRHIAVIGAGMAGLSCATHLQEHGMQVTVFEKSRGPAGRMSTRRGEGWQCDHGAQYFTASDPGFRAALAGWQQAGAAALWTPRLQVLGESDRTPNPAVERFVGVPGMTAPARLMAASLPVQTSFTLSAMRKEDDSWQLASTEQGWLAQHFDAVLLAVPAPQVGPLMAPHDSALAALAESATMHACWALMLHYAAPLSLPFDAAFVNQGPLRWIARDNSKPGRGTAETWLLHASAEWTAAHLEQEAESVANDLLAAFAKFGAPAPQAWAAHRWRYANTEPALHQACAWSTENAVGLCGDWLHGGKVEGAWLSGRKLADKLLQAYAAN
jgi:predicted NAD/FAD-dependent oxidoreductase